MSRKSTGDPFDAIRSFDALEVGPVHVEPKRLTALYTVVKRGRRESTELLYKYEEVVFDPNSDGDRNLASMIAAQVALNYGLFCDRIVFHGEFDAADRRLLQDMAENTAREIYVKKFLEPNPFLVGVSLPAVKRKSYLRAKLEFNGQAEAPSLIRWSPAESPHNRIAVSSSGGKDSLLSFALLDELGYDVHPVFGNESGRHWFTALNSYRDFAGRISTATRVWMNSDRVFAWMLRQLPFIRPDFASVRSDEYPIRLWTVAVFLFGALPLLRKRGIGRFVIGDEFDTTDRRMFQGIPHYNGLYDQSRHFDSALSRYYRRKKWALSQFSILRPLSELLIQRVLVNRYPRLFRNQVSCHATHKDGDRIRPCGKCEKCRRIVAMVIACGGDPTDCGYTTPQIDAALDAVARENVHQEAAGSEHLMWLLEQQGRLQAGIDRRTKGVDHPEVLKLRFDSEHAPMDGVPTEMRVPLYRILLAHAEGAVQRKGRTWQEIDPLTDPRLQRPYAHERSKPAPERKRTESTVTGNEYVLGQMTWPVARARFEEVDIALLPVGAIEQHGPHLPLDTDAFDADYLARRVAEACSRPKPIVLPLVSYGVSYHHDEFSGTLSVSNQALSRFVYEIGLSAARNGITKLVIINGHGGNNPALNYAAQEINRDAHIFVAVDTGETSDVDIDAMIDTPNDVHAGEIETSTSLAVRPELVRMDLAEKLVPEFSNRYLDFTSKRGVPWYAFTKRISDSGVMGDPTKATAEKGERMWDVMATNLTAFVEDLKGITLDEIFQKRY